LLLHVLGLDCGVIWYIPNGLYQGLEQISCCCEVEPCVQYRFSGGKQT